MIEDFLNALKKYAINNSDVQSVIIVGSYARGTNTATSDLDLCIISTSKSEMIENPNFIKVFGAFEKKQIEYYGACTSIRVWYENGFEVEFGIVEPSWISLPLDVGTQKVLSDGYKVLVDKVHYFSNLKL